MVYGHAKEQYEGVNVMNQAPVTWTTVTKQGDTWDSLAYQIYGSEMLAHLLLLANPQYMKMIFLPAGLVVSIPQVPGGTISKISSPLPPWARR
jgi:phage tail protein X